MSSSKCRLDILDRLIDHPMTSGELEGEVPYTASTVRRNLKILEDMGWLEKEGRTYAVQPEKKFLVAPLLRTDSILRTYGEHREHWESHDLSPIPQDLKEDFGMLRGGEVVSGTTVNPRLPLEWESELARGSERIWKLSPAYVPEYGEMARKWSGSGKDVEVISTLDAVEAFKRDKPGVPGDLLEAGALDIRVVDALLVGLMVGDDFVTLNLPRTDGTFDLSRIYIARTPEAVEWGERLFRHYRRMSRSLYTDGPGARARA